jgi:hypothetical protein
MLVLLFVVDPEKEAADGNIKRYALPAETVRYVGAQLQGWTDNVQNARWPLLACCFPIRFPTNCLASLHVANLTTSQLGPTTAEVNIPSAPLPEPGPLRKEPLSEKETSVVVAAVGIQLLAQVRAKGMMSRGLGVVEFMPVAKSGGDYPRCSYQSPGKDESFLRKTYLGTNPNIKM